MIQEQREYVIPLRREFLKVPRYQRSKKALKAIREFIKKHMKTENVVIDPILNEYVWAKGIKNPPSKVSVKAIPKKENDKEYVFVELITMTTGLKRKQEKLKQLKERAEIKKKEKENKLESMLQKQQTSDQQKNVESKNQEELEEEKNNKEKEEKKSEKKEETKNKENINNTENNKNTKEENKK